MTRIEDIVRSELVKFKKIMGVRANWEVNAGYCDGFAVALAAKLKSKGYHPYVWYTPLHGWVEVDGRHYDAEAPKGVSTVFELSTMGDSYARQVIGTGQYTRRLV